MRHDGRPPGHQELRHKQQHRHQERVGNVNLVDRAAAQAYVDGPIVARMKANPDITDLQIRIFDVRERMTAITNGPVPGLAMAAE